ncbi:MAG: Na+/H+ antiporter subunit E [Serpentinimonas sp.]|nr:Na+/H+ antiporter subunit E [Serpentinimonas sp.]
MLERLRMGVRGLALPALALGLVWLLLLRQPGVWPGADGWVLGALALALALWARRRCASALTGQDHAQGHAHCMTVQAPSHALPAPRLRWRALLRLLWVFAWQSLLGALDVTRRVCTPRMPLQPGLLELELRLPSEGQQVLLALLVSLMPGTLAARLEGGRLTLHALDTRLPIAAEVRHLEELVAALYASEATPKPLKQP